ncbi:MAG: protein-glutamate O-methyltransferase CheR [Bacteroidota bacterium]|nr:protein-glutamate O-methyltransferase CheR [Bacteroidota bacterium]MDX5430093.1 protein-glutamate O-methyltransferase CheR [Bacteroidota bacterium]MDX5468857.1 protein-glutamate O-methyltransferase CheR [Bacteroidota bacterium]
MYLTPVDTPAIDLSNQELLELCDRIANRTGVRFHHYAKASLKRRLERFMQLKQKNMEKLLRDLEKNQELAEHLVEEITVNVTEMFRNPEFFHRLQELVFPELEQERQIKIWHAGCSTGEEVFSTAILLKEHGLLERSTLLGTDLNNQVIQKAKSGSLALRQINAYLDAYFLSAGHFHLQDYFEVKGQTAHLKTDILRSCIFRTEEITSHKNEGQYDLIMCRNTLIYFDLEMQDKVIDVFFRNLKSGGFLCLGEKETIRFTRHAHRFDEVDMATKIYRKK